MSKFGKDIDPNVGVKFGQGQDPTKGGRKPSIRKQLSELLEKDGKITIPTKQIAKLNDDGSVTIILPTQMQMAMKLVSWAMQNKGSESLKAIQMIMEQIDGKPKQEIDVSGSLDGEVKRLTPEERKQLDDKLDSEY